MALLTLALLLDLLVGDPDWLWRRVPHPVAWFGKIIDWFDDNRGHFSRFDPERNGERQVGISAGVGLIVALLVMSLLVGRIVYSITEGFSLLGWAIELLLVAVLIAQKSLYDHVKRVANGLRHGGVAEGRKAVSMIVGRDVSQLDESGVSRASIESLAENFSDGVVAPALWYAILGLPGIVFYKAVNTADSMVGHRTERYEYFGKPAARLDDVLNWPAARLTSLLVVAAMMVGKGSKKARLVWDVTKRDAVHHRSPNAGWPESSFAAALGLSLGGPRNYGDDYVDAMPLNGEGRNNCTLSDIDAALALFLRSCFILIALSGFCWLFFG